MSLSVVILTFNAEATIRATAASALRVSDDVHAVDSGSSDATLAILAELGITTTHHPFESYGAQRNWAIANLPLKHGWQLHLDADERLSDGLVTEIERLKSAWPAQTDGFFIPRLVQFLGAPIRHGGMYPIYHMRLFRTGIGRCEDRKYDQHFFVTSGRTARLTAPMIDDIRMGLGEWTARHNRWADAEAAEIRAATTGPGIVAGRFDGNPVEKKRALRGWYNRAPRFWRAFALFLYRYVLRGGFRDGVPGLIFFVLQTFWFRFLVDAKLWEGERGHG